MVVLSGCSKNCPTETITKTELVYEGKIINAFSCGYAFNIVTAENFLPTNLAPQFQVNELRVRIRFELFGESTFCPGFVGNAQKINILTISVIP